MGTIAERRGWSVFGGWGREVWVVCGGGASLSHRPPVERHHCCRTKELTGVCPFFWFM